MAKGRQGVGTLLRGKVIHGELFSAANSNEVCQTPIFACSEGYGNEFSSESDALTPGNTIPSEKNLKAPAHSVVRPVNSNYAHYCKTPNLCYTKNHGRRGDWHAMSELVKHPGPSGFRQGCGLHIGWRESILMGVGFCLELQDGVKRHGPGQ